MTLLLDTHTILWMTEQVPRLGKAARRSCDVALAAGDLAISAITFYEVGQLVRRGRLADFTTVRNWRLRLLSVGVREVALSSEIAIGAAELDELHRDPIDRIIIATAMVEGATLLTADRPILDWPGLMARQDARR